MDTQDIPALNVIPRVLLDMISRLESDELQFTWKLSRNKEGFSLAVNQVHVPAKRVPRDQANTSSTVDVESKPRKSKKKSPSALAHDRARRKLYRKKKAALKAASRQREQTSRDSGKGETAAPKELDSVAPQLSEEPASHCVIMN